MSDTELLKSLGTVEKEETTMRMRAKALVAGSFLSFFVLNNPSPAAAGSVKLLIDRANREVTSCLEFARTYEDRRECERLRLDWVARIEEEEYQQEQYDQQAGRDFQNKMMMNGFNDLQNLIDQMHQD